MTRIKKTFLMLFLGVSIYNSFSFASDNDKDFISAVNNAAANQNLFIENKGQITDLNNNTRSDILFVGPAKGGKAFLRKSGISYVMTKKTGAGNDLQLNDQLNNIFLHRVDVDFVDVNPNASVESERSGDEYFNYYFSHCTNGVTQAKAYREIIYKEIYTGIDVAFYNRSSSGLKYNFIIHPGGDPTKIKLKYTGAEELQITNKGELRINTSLGELTERIPKVYQNVNGKIVDIETKYVLEGSTISFKLNTYNLQLPLIVDPWITYFGGEDIDQTYGIDTDAGGNVIITGQTASLLFPVTTGAYQTNHGPGYVNAFVAKFNSSGTRLWATYYGGDGSDRARGIATDANNNIAITGYTNSSDFPCTPSAFQTNFGGGSTDAFVVSLNSLGTRQWATQCGGGDEDRGFAIATDNFNNVLITGATASTDFPYTTGAFKTSLGNGAGVYDAFVVQFNSSGSQLWGTYCGGNNTDMGNGICTDNNNNVLVTGETNSPNFPTFAGTQMGYAGNQDAFVIKFNTTGARRWATYYGGNNDVQVGNGITSDVNGNVIFTGSTLSNNFPITTGAFQTNKAGIVGTKDAFVVKLDSTCVRQWATYLGGSNEEEGHGIVADNNSDIYVTGDTYSNNFPVTSCAYQTQFGGDEDNYLAKFSASGSRICSGYIGGTGHDESHGSCALNGSLVYMGGFSNGAYPVTPGAYQTAFAGGGDDSFVSELCGNTCGKKPPINLDFSASQVNFCTGTSINFSSITSNLCDTSGTSWLWTFTGASTSTSTLHHPTNIIYNNPGTYTVKLNITSQCGKDSLIKPAYLTVNGPDLAPPAITNVLCNGSANGTAAINIASGTGPFTYAWSPAGGTNNTASGLQTGSYTITVTDGGGCSVTDSLTITQPASLFALITLHTNVICNGDSTGSIAASAIGGTTGYNYSWAPSNNTNTSITGLVSGSYSLTITDANNCSSVTTVAITQPSPVIVSSSNASMCIGSNTILTAFATGGVSNYSYTWNPGGTTGVSIVVSPTDFTTYFVNAIDSNGCSSAIKTVSVIVNQLPVLTVSQNDTICFGSQTTLTAAGAVNFIWGPSAGLSSTAGSTVMADPFILTTYTVIGTDVNNCSDSAFVSVTVNSPTVAVSADVTILQGANTIISASGGGTYSWYPSEGLSCVTCAVVTASPQHNSTYYVIVTDAAGCTKLDSIVVSVELVCGEIFVPTAFSPNNDGQNEILFLLGNNCIKTLLFSIYDRWGEKMFETTDPSVGWDGWYRNKLLNTGVYIYHLNAISINGTEVVRTGNISLIR